AYLRPYNTHPRPLHDALPISKLEKPIKEPRNRLLKWIENGYEKAINYLLHHYKKAVVIGFGIVFLLCFSGLKLGTEFLRELDERSEEHTSELQSRENLVCRLL